MGRVRGWVAFAGFAVIAAACSADTAGVETERADDVGATVGTDDGAGTPSDPDTGATDPDVAGTAVGGVESGPDPSTLEWSPCEDGIDVIAVLDCATLRVPLDHADPDSEMIDLAVARSPATGLASERIGSLVFNPGGPGGSGVEALAFLPLTMSPDIAARFDLVSFDPRGVGSSTALDCDVDLDDGVTLLAEGDDAGWVDLVDANEADLARCSTATSELAPYVGTNNAARDLDLLRAALGDDGLSYVGYSYGTRLGATYAELFPDNVRALVLDAAVRPTDDFAELDREQSGGFDLALENFAAACDADTDCVLQDLGPTLDVLAALNAEAMELGGFPTDDPDRRLEPGELSLGVAAALYSKDSWPFLAQALFVAEVDQDGSLLQALADSLAGRRPDGTYDNSQVASRFINCADNPARPSEDEQRAEASAAASESVYFDDFFRASTGCLGIVDPIDPLLIGPASGAPPIVVIGNTGDPATPYEWSVELADALESAVLYTVEAEGHTAYGSIECVTADIDAYLIDLVSPADGARCSDNADADFFVPAGESQTDQIFAFFECLRDNGADIAEFTIADLIADPTLGSILAELDFADPAFVDALEPCFGLIPEI